MQTFPLLYYGPLKPQNALHLKCTILSSILAQARVSIGVVVPSARIVLASKLLDSLDRIKDVEAFEKEMEHRE